MVVIYYYHFNIILNETLLGIELLKHYQILLFTHSQRGTNLSPPHQGTSAYRVRPVLRISLSLPQCLRIVKIERDVVKNRPLLLPLKSSSVKKNRPVKR